MHLLQKEVNLKGKSIIARGTMDGEQWENSLNEKMGMNFGMYNITSEDIANKRIFKRYKRTTGIEAKVLGGLFIIDMTADEKEYEYTIPPEIVFQSEIYTNGRNITSPYDTVYTNNYLFPRKGFSLNQSNDFYQIYGYWICEDSAYSYDSTCLVYCNAFVPINSGTYYAPNYACRPIVLINKSDFEEVTGIKIEE